MQSLGEWEYHRQPGLHTVLCSHVNSTVYSAVLCTCLTVYSAVQCTVLYSVQRCTVYSDVLCTVLYSLQCCTVYSDVQCTVLYNVQCFTVYSAVQCTALYSTVNCALHCGRKSAHCTVQTVLCTLYNPHSTVHIAL